MIRKFRPYQKQGYNAIFSAWDAHDVIMFVLATGGGKTYTFTEVIREYCRRGLRTMLIAHREELITQAWQTLYDAQILAGIIKADQPRNFDRQVQVCSIQTIARRQALPHADLIVIDEAHHVQDDNTYGKILAMFPHAKVLLVTATPYRLSGDGFRFLIPGSAKETHLIVNCTLSELIKEGWLVPLQYHIGAKPDLTEVKLSKGEYEEDSLQKAMEMVPIVESYKKHCFGLQGLCFCINKSHSKGIAEQYNEAGIPAVHIDDSTPPDMRKKYLADYRAGKIWIVCNVGIFTEGTDFPNCQFVQLAAPSKSLSKIFQEKGRVTRALPGIVDQYETAEERRAAIAASSKPYGIILDNAGMWLEHPFADDDINWFKYFNGWEKPKKQKAQDAEEPEYIEIPIYEVESPGGNGVRRTSNPEEVEGLVLIRVTKEMRVNLRAMKHVKEFERIYNFACNSNKVNKPGYFAYIKYREHCDSNGITIPEIVWKYLKEILIDNVELEIESYITQRRGEGKATVPSFNSDIEKIRQKGVHKYYLQKEKANYMAGDRSYFKRKDEKELQTRSPF
jgi:superfamily II DNA or RNA helicase